MHGAQADRGVFITTSRFTTEAVTQVTWNSAGVPSGTVQLA